MALRKDIEIAAYGVIATHHVIDAFSCEMRASRCHVTVDCYASAQAYADGKSPLVREAISLSESPPDDVPARAWIQAKLVELPADPSQTPPGLSPIQYISPNRWLFAGAEIVAD